MALGLCRAVTKKLAIHNTQLEIKKSRAPQYLVAEGKQVGLLQGLQRENDCSFVEEVRPLQQIAHHALRAGRGETQDGGKPAGFSMWQNTSVKPRPNRAGEAYHQ